MAIGPIVTRGFGSFGSIALVALRGFLSQVLVSVFSLDVVITTGSIACTAVAGTITNSISAGSIEVTIT